MYSTTWNSSLTLIFWPSLKIDLSFNKFQFYRKLWHFQFHFLFFKINLSTNGPRRVWITGDVKPTSTWMIIMKMVIKVMMMMILNNLYDRHWTKRWSDSCSPPRRRCWHSTWGPRRCWQPGIRWLGLWSKAILLSWSLKKEDGSPWRPSSRSSSRWGCAKGQYRGGHSTTWETKMCSKREI